ncbi:putative RNA-binding protein [Yarrowia sp. C11]|nr:putative RNA-binding protein [Yarrowia sp. E02]KAG5372497.1 putative RNA-binding protein [Yarrowia sp. C11]
MIPENEQPQLKQWALQQLENLSDADTSILGDYVIALANYDMPKSELAEMCRSQLTEFLHGNTDAFVEALMHAIETKSYMQEPLQQQQQQAQQQQQNFPQQQQQGQFPTPPPFPPGFDFAQMQQMGFPMTGMNVPLPSSQGFISGKRYNNGGNKRGMSALSTPHSSTEYNRKLVVEKIPEDYCSEQAVRDFFSKFGTLTSVKVNVPGKLAEIEFSTTAEAKNAYKSSETIFDNRFVKVYWRRTDDETPEDGIAEQQRLQEERQAAFEEKEQRRKEHLEKMTGILAQKKQLLEMQIEQQELLAKMGQPVTQDVDELRNQLAEILEHEKDPTKVFKSNSAASSYAPRGRGGFRGRGTRGRGAFRGRGGFHPYGAPPARENVDRSKFSLDLRPKDVLISPVTPDKQEHIRAHLVSVGEYSNVSQANGDSVVVSFPDRRAAEKFFYGSADIPDVGKVEKQWFKQAKNEGDATGIKTEDVKMEEN